MNHNGGAMMIRGNDDWVAILAHELQQPINSIRLSAELMLRGQLDTKERATMERICSSSAHLGRMICNFKMLSALDSARVILDKTPIDLSKLLGDVTSRFVDLDGRVTLELPDGPVIATCDRCRIEQVLTNLLSNAAKYGDEDAPIALALDIEDAAITISVTNRGSEISADELETVFDRDFRTRSARASGIPGSGLGLYVAKCLVDAHGGRIGVTSACGTTTFRFTIPR
jgi:signal transduction histidine kinase